MNFVREDSFILVGITGNAKWVVAASLDLMLVELSTVQKKIIFAVVVPNFPVVKVPDRREKLQMFPRHQSRAVSNLTKHALKSFARELYCLTGW
jgi:hypothetical protein